MAILSCFRTLSARKKKDKGNSVSSMAVALRALHMKKLEQASVRPLDNEELKSMACGASALSESRKNFLCSVRTSGEGGPSATDAAAEVAYEGEDEHEENASIKREFSDFDLQAKGVDSIHEWLEMTEKNVVKEEGDVVKSFDIIQSGHVSDPGIGRAEFWVSPRLKRSCSNLERRDVLRKAAHRFPSSKSHSFEELWELPHSAGDLLYGSPVSIMTHRSADRVMLKKHSSSQILPSANRKLWWKLFLWSHRNLQQARTAKAKAVKEGAIMNQHGGYYSDTLEPEPNQVVNSSNMESPGSFTEQSTDKSPIDKYNENCTWDGFRGGLSGLWQQKQWVGFPAGSSSSFSRVNEWVRDLETESIQPADNANSEELITFPPSPDNGKAPATSTGQMARASDIYLSEEILHANAIIQSLNPSSRVAYMSGTGLKAVPTISCFSSLKSVDLSNNFIGHITPGSLPKGLHVLNLSRNKINTIEGLRELTRLRVLNLSYNRISGIGYGLSNCTLIKELYLAGNKISDVEGLHRLLKLTVLDLSFNKITTTKALGQLVANYNSLVALNLLGNPIESNISDDQLRKAVCSLLPKLTYLNKQSIKPQRAREVLTDSVAKAALGSGSLSSRRRVARRVGRVGPAASSGTRSSAVAQKSSKKSKGKSHRR